MLHYSWCENGVLKPNLVYVLCKANIFLLFYDDQKQIIE